jgi:hypothetical protein
MHLLNAIAIFYMTLKNYCYASIRKLQEPTFLVFKMEPAPTVGMHKTRLFFSNTKLIFDTHLRTPFFFLFYVAESFCMLEKIALH